MDLGATICRPINPQCDICPIQSHCLAYAKNQQKVLPINIKNIKHQEIHYTTGIITYQKSDSLDSKSSRITRKSLWIYSI